LLAQDWITFSIIQLPIRESRKLLYDLEMIWPKLQFDPSRYCTLSKCNIGKVFAAPTPQKVTIVYLEILGESQNADRERIFCLRAGVSMAHKMPILFTGCKFYYLSCWYSSDF
jgi:hypothetical protein